MTNGSRNERWLAAMMTPPVRGMCSRPTRLMRKYTRQNGSTNAAGDPVDDGVDAPSAGTFEEAFAIHCPPIPARGDDRYSLRTHGHRSRQDRSRSRRRRVRRRGVGGAAAGRQGGVRRRLRRHRAARQGSYARARVAGGRVGDAPRQRRGARRGVCDGRAADAGAVVGARAACRADRASRDVAADGGRRPRASGARRHAAACGLAGARSRRRRGATCCSASCWASSSGG